MEELNHPNLPKGWKWCFKRRAKGKSKIKIDMYIFTDDGKRIRSSKQLRNYLSVNNIAWMPTESEQKYLFMPSVIFKNQQYPESATTYKLNKKEMENKFTAEDIGSTNQSVENNISEQNDINILNTQCDNFELELKKDEYCNISENGFEAALDPSHIEDISRYLIPAAESTYNENDHHYILETNDCPITVFEETTENNYDNRDGLDQIADNCVNVKKWVPPRSPYNLLQETFYHDPWQLLIATIFLSKTQVNRATEFFCRFIEKWPTPEILLKESQEIIANFLAPLGLHQLRARNIHKFTYDFLQKKWKDPMELHGIGKYGSDSYKIFCLGQWDTTSPQDHMLIRVLTSGDDVIEFADQLAVLRRRCVLWGEFPGACLQRATAGSYRASM